MPQVYLEADKKTHDVEPREQLSQQHLELGTVLGDKELLYNKQFTLSSNNSNKTQVQENK